MKKQALYYIIFLSFLMTQFNNCSPADISSGNITALSALEAEEEQNNIEDDTNNNDNTGTPKLFYKQDFETDTAGMMPFNSADRIKENGYSGSYSLRSNLSPYMTDPITGRTGSFSLMGMSEMDIVGNTQSEVYMKFWFKFDNVEWDSTKTKLGANEVHAKIYLSKNVSVVPDPESSSFVVLLNGGAEGKIKLMDNYDGLNDTELWNGWIQSDLAWLDGGLNAQKFFHAKTGGPFGSDGEWHSFELHIKYENLFHLAQVKIDGKPAMNAKNTNTEGYFKLPPQFKLHQFSLLKTEEMYVKDAKQVNEGQFPVGVQIDNVELWSQRP